MQDHHTTGSPYAPCKAAILLDDSTRCISLACPFCRDYPTKKGIAVSWHPGSLQSLAAAIQLFLFSAKPEETDKPQIYYD